ncbi:Probable pectate lyase 13 [Dionaea muscipula]
MLPLKSSCILIPIWLLTISSSPRPPNANASPSNLTLPHQHPNPEEVVQDLHRRVDASLSGWQKIMPQLSSSSSSSSSATGNPIDDCWRSDPDWASNRQRLADCAIGFGRNALGGKGGPIYVVTDSSDPENPKPGTLRDAVTRPGPLWIIFSSNMLIRLGKPLMMTSHKTIDGRGANVQITGVGCVYIQQVTGVIIHNINIHHCSPSADSDGDGLHVFAATNVWIDHCTLSECADGLIDCTVGSTSITISNNYFFNHEKVMLLGHSDEYVADMGMQVTVAFNRFGHGLSQRMPRCRFGYFHVVNNDYTGWGLYAVGGSAHPTINSQGNRYTAPSNANNKEVTMRMDAGSKGWEAWNWRTEGDMMLNGAFFVPSGDGLMNSAVYAMASSLAAKSASFIDQLTMNAGVMLPNGGTGTSISSGGGGDGDAPAGGGGGSGYGGEPADGSSWMIFGSSACSPSQSCHTCSCIIFSALITLHYFCPFHFQHMIMPFFFVFL